jgi:hypothetical protein
MTGTWPNLDSGDLETRVRTYLNEVVADFYTQAEIWRWLSVAAKDIAQKTTCVRRILDAQTAASTRTVPFNAYKVFHVEYLPTTGRSVMLTKISPLQVGHYPFNGTYPQYWYQFGSIIGIDPLPDTTYFLRLYVADIPKIQYTTYPVTNFSGWTAGTGWTASGAVHTGSTSGTLTENTSILSVSSNYTIMFTVSGLANGGIVLPALGDTAGFWTNSPGPHAQSITTSATASPKISFSALEDVTISNLYILKEANFSSASQQTELPPMWQNLLALYATYNGLIKSKRAAAAKLLETIYGNELAFLRQNVVEVIPDGKNDQIYK